MPKIFTALITPFHQNGNVDYPALRKLVKKQLEQGSDGFIVCGTTAETPTLTHRERMKILDEVIQINQGIGEIWYGCGSNNTRAAIKACLEAQRKAINGVLLVTPYYNRPSQEGIYQHFMHIDQAINTKIMLYNIPSRTGSEMKKNTLFRLVENTTHIVALKQASKDLSLISDTLIKYPDFSFYSGEDDLFEEGIDAGMKGVVSVMSHIAMKPLNIYLKEKKDPITKQFLQECAYMSFIDASPSPIKYMLNKLGYCENVLRLPMVQTNKQAQKEIEEWMTKNDKYFQPF